MSMDKPTVVLKWFFGNSLIELYKTLRRLQSYLVAFKEQIQNIEKSKAQLFIEFISCFATVKARIQERRKYMNSDKAQRKEPELTT